MVRARRPHDSPLADSNIERHCDRYGGTVASRRRLVATGRIVPRQPISASRCILPITEPVRPRQGPHIGTTERVPASFARPARPVRRCGRPDDGAPLQSSAPRRSNVTYVDLTLNCVDCGVEFIHSAADQEYYQQKGFVSDPKRCTSCRASRRASRDGGYDVRDIGGPRGYERGDDRPNREYFAVICSSCGNQAQVPFKPRMDRPVYCSDCFRTVKPD